MKKSKIKLVKIIAVIFILIILLMLTGCGEKENKTENKNENEVTQENTKNFTPGTYEWSNMDEESKESIEIGMIGNSIIFREDNTFTADLGNGSYIEGFWEKNEDTILCKDVEVNSEWHKEPEKVEFEMTFKIKDKNILEIVYSKELIIHIIDMTTGKLTDETKSFPIVEFQVGNVYKLGTN